MFSGTGPCHDAQLKPQMPSKYSYSVVLADYSSRGIINFPSEDHQWDCGDISQSSTPVNVAEQAPSPLVERRKSTVGTTTQSQSAPWEERSTKRHSKSRTKSRKHEPSAVLDPTSDRAPGSIHDKPIKRSRRKDAIQNDTSQRHLSVPKPPAGSSPDFRLSGPFDPFAGNPEFVLNVESISPDADLKGQQNANISRPIRRPVASGFEKYEPRDDGRAWPTAKAPRSTARRRVNGSEPLLSVQQFLDLSPRIQEAIPPKDRRSSQSHIAQYKPPPPQSPTFHAKSTRPKPQQMDSTNSLDRSATSFIDSSDEEDDNHRNSVRQLRRRPVPGATRPQRPAIQLDLTTDLPELQGNTYQNNGARRTSQYTEPSQNRHSQQHSTDIDDSDAFDNLPLQRHSPLPKQTPVRKTLRRTGSLYQPLFDVPDELLSPLPQVSTYSPGPVSPWTTISSIEPGLDFPGFSGKALPKETDSNDVAAGYVHVRRRQDSRVEGHLPAPEQRPYISPADSFMHSPTPTQLSPEGPGSPSYLIPDRTGRVTRISSVSHQRPDLSRSRGSEPRGQAESLPSPTSGLALRIPRKPVNPMPLFGTPSVIRDPHELAKLNVQNVSRSNSPFPVKTKPSPQKFLQQQRQWLRSSSDLTRVKTGSRTPEPTIRSSATSTRSSREDRRRPSVQTLASANFGEEGWGRVSVEPAAWGGSVTHLGPAPPVAARSELSVGPFGEQAAPPPDEQEEDDDEDAALPPPDISRRRKTEDILAGSVLPSRSQSRARFGPADHGLEAMLQNDEPAPTPRARSRSRSILGRFGRRR